MTLLGAVQTTLRADAWDAKLKLRWAGVWQPTSQGVGATHL
jgi:hypothetical protein